ncbi:MAG: glycosyl hydrolase family 65 protein [Bacillota bacterium]
MAVVYGFGGFRLKESGFYFAPVLPAAWTAYRFKLRLEESRIAVEVKEHECVFRLENGPAIKIFVYGQEYRLTDTLTVGRQPTATGTVLVAGKSR